MLVRRPRRLQNQVCVLVIRKFTPNPANAPRHMDTAWISAFSAVMGSLVGAFTSFVTTYANQRAQYRRDFLSKQFAQREILYSEFINEAARLLVDALEHQMEKTSTLVAIYALENRIRLIASQEVVQAAENTIKEIVE